MLVGRTREIDEVRGALASGGTAVLVGPAGIGKSTLAQASLSGANGFREGGALATLNWAPFLVFQRLLRSAPPELPDEVADAVLQEPDRPVLLDDMQWSDDASLEVVARLVGRVPMLVTVRTGEARSDQVIEALTLVGFDRFDVAPLGTEASATLADHLHPGLDPSARDGLLAAAAGNPLLLTELPLGSDAAPSLVSALVARIGGLSPSGRSAVERLAVLGRPASASVLGPGIDSIVAVGLAEPVEDGAAISHSLLAEVIVDGLGARSDDIRRQLAALVDPDEGAHLLAAAGDRAAARALALQAASTGPRRRQAELLALAVACADDLDASTRLRAARLFSAVSEPARARQLCDVPGRDELPPVDRGGLLGAEAEAAWMQGHQIEAMDLTSRAMEDLRGSRTAAEVAVMAGSTVAQTFVDLDGRPALERAREADRLADEIGAEQGYARTRLASVLLTAGEPGWVELYGEVIQDAQRDGDEGLRRTATGSLLLGLWITGDPHEAERLARGELDRGPQQEFDVGWLTVVAYSAILGLVTGRPRDAMVVDLEPLLERWTAFRSRQFLEASVILALADGGHHARAAGWVARSVAHLPPEPQWASIVLWAQGEAGWLAGRLPEAVACAEQVLAIGIGDYPSAVQSRLVGSHAARELGRGPIGPAPIGLLPAWAPATQEWAGLEAAAEGRTVDAVDAFVAAADGWASTDVRSEVRCRWAAGDVAARAGEGSAEAILLQAEARADDLGFSAMAERIRRSLRSLGIVRRSVSGPGPAGLTPREEQVLELIGSGMRSTDVAAALGVEVSTVESFVRSARQKLGSSTRAGAAARLRSLRVAEGLATAAGPNDPSSG